MATRHLRRALTWTGGAIGVAAGAYAGYVALTWLRYGHAASATADSVDPLLDRFMPVYDVVERHHIDVAAPAQITFAAACEQDLMAGPLARGIFKAREVVLGSQPNSGIRPRGLLEMTKSIGWGVLADVPGREIVMGAVTQPWQANVVFRPLPPAEFLAFDEPEYVKIVWMLQADAISSNKSIFRTETRAVATDAAARAKFRRYWSFLSPGIILIRWAVLNRLRAEAERRTRLGGHGSAGLTHRSETDHWDRVTGVRLVSYPPVAFDWNAAQTNGCFHLACSSSFDS